MSIKRLVRGEARPSDLSNALDELGVEDGQEFLLAALEQSIADAALAADPTAQVMGGFTADSETSRQAALDNWPRQGSQRERVLTAVLAAGDHGLTAFEAAEVTKIAYRSLTPRIGELKRCGWVQKDGDRTRSTDLGSEAEVLVATPKAAEYAGERAPEDEPEDPPGSDALFEEQDGHYPPMEDDE